MQFGIRRLPPNDDSANNQQTQKRRHQYWRYELFTKIEILARHTDRPIVIDTDGILTATPLPDGQGAAHHHRVTLTARRSLPVFRD
jgi:hypothetical protein